MKLPLTVYCTFTWLALIILDVTRQNWPVALAVMSAAGVATIWWTFKRTNKT